jgi:SAM-dependent methyltransferase
MNFGPLYSSGYDLLNEGKDYASELIFVFDAISTISESRFEPKSVIDFGCGSGKHLAELPVSVSNVVGVDRSNEMLSVAKKNLPDSYRLINSEIGKFKTSEKFDLVMSLFHVASYQTTLHEIGSYWNSLAESLSDEGYIFVDFWHRPPWENDPPVERLTEKSNPTVTVKRRSVPKVDLVQGIVDIDIDVTFSSSGQPDEKYLEQHRLRAFSLLEIQLAGHANGLEVVKHGAWMDVEGNLKPSTWYGYVILKKRISSKF